MHQNLTHFSVFLLVERVKGILGALSTSKKTEKWGKWILEPISLFSCWWEGVNGFWEPISLHHLLSGLLLLPQKQPTVPLDTGIFYKKYSYFFLMIQSSITKILKPELLKFSSIIEYGYGKEEKFRTAHIPNAFYLDSTKLQQAPQWMLKSDEHIMSMIRSSGLKDLSFSQANVLVYNRCFDELGIMPSCRLALLLLHYGIANVSILLDGLNGFQNCLDNHLTLINLSLNLGVFQGTKKIIRNKDDVVNLLQSGSEQLLDVRTQLEWKGDVPGYDYCTLRGRIPGSIFHGDLLSKKTSETKAYGLDGKFLTLWKEQGIQLDKSIVVYCGNGWRASLVMVYALVCGVQDISLYSNGWIQWSRGSDLQAKL